MGIDFGVWGTCREEGGAVFGGLKGVNWIKQSKGREESYNKGFQFYLIVGEVLDWEVEFWDGHGGSSTLSSLQLKDYLLRPSAF